ncbi:MAG: N-acetyl sugar amidotransferase [Bacteroidales bacterium]
MSYQRCSRCVMDNNGDTDIRFDDNGVCSYCTEALERKNIVYFPNKEGQDKLRNLIDRLKKEGEGKKYDCMMGVSGGLDSSYLAMLGAKWGLRILAIHIDDGFDTEVAKSNIENLCLACNISLETIKPDSEQFNGLTKAFVLSGSSTLDMPQDNVLFAILHSFAKRYKIKYFLSGGNFALESILQRTSGSNAYDTRKIKHIHKKYGDTPIDRLDIMSNYQRIIDKYIYKFITVRPLNYIDYNKDRAIEELRLFCGFQYYEAKHCENYLTKVVQLYWFPLKFNYDKRKSHLSSLIVTGQMEREVAVKELEKAPVDVPNMERDLTYVLSKLKVSRELFDEIIERKGDLFSDEKSSLSYKIASKLFKQFFVRFKG